MATQMVARKYKYPRYNPYERPAVSVASRSEGAMAERFVFRIRSVSGKRACWDGWIRICSKPCVDQCFRPTIHDEAKLEARVTKASFTSLPKDKGKPWFTHVYKVRGLMLVRVLKQPSIVHCGI